MTAAGRVKDGRSLSLGGNGSSQARVSIAVMETYSVSKVLVSAVERLLTPTPLQGTFLFAPTACEPDVPCSGAPTTLLQPLHGETASQALQRQEAYTACWTQINAVIQVCWIGAELCVLIHV